MHSSHLSAYRGAYRDAYTPKEGCI
jgi:hypothetical protein